MAKQSCTLPKCLLDFGLHNCSSTSSSLNLVGTDFRDGVYFTDNVRLSAFDGNSPLQPTTRLWKVDGNVPSLTQSWEIIAQLDGVLISSQLSSTKDAVALLICCLGENNTAEITLSVLQLMSTELAVKRYDISKCSEEEAVLSIGKILSFDTHTIILEAPSPDGSRTIYFRLKLDEQTLSAQTITSFSNTPRNKRQCVATEKALHIVEKNSTGTKFYTFAMEMDHMLEYNLPRENVLENFDQILPMWKKDGQRETVVAIVTDKNTVSVSQMQLNEFNRTICLLPRFKMTLPVCCGNRQSSYQLDIDATRGTVIVLTKSKPSADVSPQMELQIHRGLFSRVCSLKQLAWHTIQHATTGATAQELTDTVLTGFKGDLRCLFEINE